MEGLVEGKAVAAKRHPCDEDNCCLNSILWGKKHLRLCWRDTRCGLGRGSELPNLLTYPGHTTDTLLVLSHF